MIHQDRTKIDLKKAKQLNKLIVVATAVLGPERVNEIYRETYGKSLDMWQIHVNNVIDETYLPGSSQAQAVINSYDKLIFALRQAAIIYIQML